MIMLFQNSYFKFQLQYISRTNPRKQSFVNVNVQLKRINSISLMISSYTDVCQFTLKGILKFCKSVNLLITNQHMFGYRVRLRLDMIWYINLNLRSTKYRRYESSYKCVYRIWFYTPSSFEDMFLCSIQYQGYDSKFISALIWLLFIT